MGKGSLITKFLCKLLILLIITVIVVGIYFLKKEKITPMRLELSNRVRVSFVLTPENVLEVHTNNWSERKKLSYKTCKELNEIIRNIVSNPEQNHQPSSLNVSDGVDIKAIIGDETYLNIYGAYENYELDDLDWLTYKLIKESPKKLEWLERCIKFPEKYESK